MTDGDDEMIGEEQGDSATAELGTTATEAVDRATTVEPNEGVPVCTPAPAPAGLSPDERTVLAVLQRHRGRGRAIHKEELAESVGLDVRKVRMVIVRLIENHHQPIGSVSSAPAGYFLIDSEDDADQAAHELQVRIVSLAQRLAKLKHNTPADCLAQLRLKLGTEAA